MIRLRGLCNKSFWCYPDEVDRARVLLQKWNDLQEAKQAPPVAAVE